MRFENKTVVITGAASGIGRATALRFAAEGATVLAADIDVAGSERLAGESGGAIRFQRTDIGQPQEIDALMQAAAAIGGGIDIVFNNAGAVGAIKPIDEIGPTGWTRTMDLLLTSVAMGIRYAVPHMKGRAGAAIINTTSVAGLEAGWSPVGYSVAKAAVIHLTRVGAADLARHGIRMNAVCPGFIDTSIFASSLALDASGKAAANALAAPVLDDLQPIRPRGKADDIAAMVLFLASAEARFTTGQNIVVDGGLTIGPRHSWDEHAAPLFADMAEMAGKANR